MANVSYKRYRFNIPDGDESTLKWCDAQVNLSMSLRHLIRTAIERDGYIDAMCTPVAQLPKVGRPAGSKNKTENMLQETVQPDISVMHEVSQAVPDEPAFTDAPQAEPVRQEIPAQPAAVSQPAPPVRVQTPPVQSVPQTVSDTAPQVQSEPAAGDVSDMLDNFDYHANGGVDINAMLNNL